MKKYKAVYKIAVSTAVVFAVAAVVLAVSAIGQQPPTSDAADSSASQPKAAYVGSDACKACHAKVAEEFDKNPHAQTLAQAPSDTYRGCESCHGPGSLHVQGPSANKMPDLVKVGDPETNQACTKCHMTDTDAPKAWQKLEAKYWKRGEHNRSGITCTACHTVHSNKPKLTTKQSPDMCLGCHSKVLGENGKKASYVHAPVAGGMCNKCHNPHGTSARHNVVSGIQQVCTACHKADTPDMVKAHGNIPVADANCTNCHSAHSHNKQAKLVKANQHMPFKSHQCGSCHKAGSVDLIKPQRELCTMCHSKDLAGDPSDGHKMHAAVQQGMCTGCHNPHASDAKKAYWKDDKLAYACFTCHSSVEYQIDGKHRHKPLEGMNCLSCHKPHMSKEAQLLVKPEMDLCGQCHKDHRLMHPIGKKADGTPVADPLRKGLSLTCTSCHTPHGGQFERMAVRDWKRDLCMGCHNKVMH